jgi:hypothetical protein
MRPDVSTKEQVSMIARLDKGSDIVRNIKCHCAQNVGEQRYIRFQYTRCDIRLEEIARRRKRYIVTRKYISRPNNVAVIYLLKSIVKDLFNTEMWNCNEIERSFQFL